MDRLLLAILLTFALLAFLSCQAVPETSSSVPTLPKPEGQLNQGANPIQPPSQHGSSTTVPADEGGKSIYDLFVPKEQQSLTYNGYTIYKRTKKAAVDYGDGKRMDHVPYSLLKSGIRVIKTFEGEPTWLSASDFALLPLLNGTEQQLLVGQTQPRSGRFWIVSLSPKFRILLDTDEYGNFREEPTVVDLDDDGTYEFINSMWDFGGIGRAFRPLSTPQPCIIFSYDRKTGRYVPANDKFQRRELDAIAEEIKALSPIADETGEVYYDRRASILLRYVFAGKEKEGWEFFEKHYQLEDKQEIMKALKAALRKQAAYRYIYSRVSPG
jgi:hypothetical protein